MGIYTRQSVCAPIRAEEGILGALCPRNSTVPYCDLPEDEHVGGYLNKDQIACLGVDAADLDSEGRCAVVEFPAFVLFGIYAPANSNGERDDFRHAFHSALDTRIRNLVAHGKRVVVTGDLNVSRDEMDTANAAETMRKEELHTMGTFQHPIDESLINYLKVVKWWASVTSAGASRCCGMYAGDFIPGERACLHTGSRRLMLGPATSALE